VKEKYPARRWTVWAVLFAGVLGAAIYYWKQTPVDVIPFPFMERQNEFTTIEWKPRVISADEVAGKPEDHPGFRLAQEHCTRCHLLPRPSQVPRETWPLVLTWMSNYLGYRNTYGPLNVIVSGSLIPPEPVLSKEEFQTLAEYYLFYSQSENETLVSVSPAKSPLIQFQPIVPEMNIPREEFITLVHFDDTTRRYYVGSGTRRVLQVYDTQGRMLLNAEADSEPVGVEIIPGGFRMSTLGGFLLDKSLGQVIDIVMGDDQQLHTTKLVENYPRLTETHSEDLNQDGVEDLLLIGFGQGETGKVSIVWRNPDGAIQGEETLIDYSGALNAEIHDFNQDQLKDIMVLTAQGRQELLLFLNEGRGNFRQQIIRKQFAGFGYNHFSVHDFNGDGRLDLLMENGNNMELKNAPRKPYHGVRILENNGDLTFTEKFFYPMPGALKAVAEDFDRDGDLDIAAIAFYPDWFQETPETFAYLENQGGYRFRPSVLAKEHWGRWITMTTGDIDGDGFPDLILGGGYVRQGVHVNYLETYREKTKNQPSVVALRNNGRKGERRP